MIGARITTGVVDYDAQVIGALAVVALRPPDALLWFGRRVTATGGESLRDLLARRLRTDFFSAGQPRPRGGGAVTSVDDGRDFVRALAQANCGRGAWQSGWQIQSRSRSRAGPAAAGVEHDGDDTLTVVRSDGLRLLAPTEDCRGEGAAAQVRVPKELAGFSPGCYVALGDTPWRDGELADRVDLYWNIAAAGAVTLVARATYALNRAQLPFSLTLPGDPARYGDCDAGILSIARTDYRATIKLLRPQLRALNPQLGGAVPPFTKPLTRGLALAERPAAGDTSFADDRCRLLAAAILAADERDLHGADERLAVVRQHFTAAEIALDAPYLQPGSDDAYDRS